MGSLPPADTKVRGSDILLRVVDWLCADQDRPCIALSDVDFMTPRAAWEEDVGSALEALYLAPGRLLDHPHLFLS